MALKSQLYEFGFSPLWGREPLEIFEEGRYVLNSVLVCNGFGEGDP